METQEIPSDFLDQRTLLEELHPRMPRDPTEAPSFEENQLKRFHPDRFFRYDRVKETVKERQCVTVFLSPLLGISPTTLLNGSDGGLYDPPTISEIQFVFTNPYQPFIRSKIERSYDGRLQYTNCPEMNLSISPVLNHQEFLNDLRIRLIYIWTAIGFVLDNKKINELVEITHLYDGVILDY